MNLRDNAYLQPVSFPKFGLFIFSAANLLIFVCSCQRIGQNKNSVTVASNETEVGSPHPLVASSSQPDLEFHGPSSGDIPVDFDPISDALSADLTPGETSSRLLALLPTTPTDDKSFLVQLAGNYCPDEEYWRLLPFLLDRNQPETCREELMRDVLRRSDTVRLRPLYRLALDPTHPLSQEAKDYLFSYLQDVPENDYTALAKAVDKAEKEGR